MSLRRTRRKEVVEDIPIVEEDEADDTTASAKIKAPIVWAVLPSGYIIQDLEDKHVESAINLVKNYYIYNEITCRTSELADDTESVDDFIQQTTFHLADKCSIVALRSGTNEVAGFTVLRVLHQKDYGKVFSRVKLISGEAYKKCSRVKAYLNRKTDMFAKYDCEIFLRVYLLCVSPKFTDADLGLAMMRASVNVARSLRIPVIMGIFTSGEMQARARKVGMEVEYEVYYVDWVENGEMVFDDPGAGNYTIALMAGRVLPLD